MSPKNDDRPRLFEDEDLLALKRVTFSEVKTYMQCPYRFQQQYLLKRRGKIQRFYHYIGTSLHTVMQHYDYGASETRNVRNLQSRLVDQWNPQVFADPIESKYWLEESTRMIETFANFNAARPPPVMVEKNVEAGLGRFRLVGRVDRVDKDGGTLEIVDFKTGNLRVPARQTLMNECQWVFYYLCVRAATGMTVDKFVYVFLRCGETVEVITNPPLVVGAERRLLGTLEQMRGAQSYPAIRNIYCQDCVFSDECSA